MQPNLEAVREFCKKSHNGQTRWNGRPYFEHPFRVAERTAVLLGQLALPADGRPSDSEILAAALLHDVIEDCRADYEDIAEPFGSAVADMVVTLSDDKRLPAGPRRAAYHETLAAAPCWVQAIKLADLMDNATDSGGDLPRRARWAAHALPLLDRLNGVSGLPVVSELRAELLRMLKSQ